ncbi:MAG: phaZ1 [Frankiales bacterium]|nr:phaZ1 [Frankiales bacterium]
MRLARPLALLAAVSAGLLGLMPPASAAGAGDVSTHSYTEPGGLTRTYLEYTPAGLQPGSPVVVFLHGCNQTAEQAMQATRFNELADTKSFTVVYPQQVQSANSSAPVADGNGIGCWNWFLPEDQGRGSGEPAVLAGLTRHVVAETQADPDRVYVEGISAGADMSVILAATYPDVFAAAASLAGCAYRTCADASGALTNTAMGSRARVVPLFVENGTADTLNPAAQSVALVQSWLGADDLADDGSANGSVSRQSADTTYAPDGTPQPGTGDACIHNNTWTCPGGVAGLSNYPYTVSTYAGDSVELWLIHGMTHAQPHSPGDGPYTDPLGPDITAASYDFFLTHPMPTPTPAVPEVPAAALLPVAALLVVGLVAWRRRTS